MNNNKELLYCPSCKLTKEEFEKHKLKMSKVDIIVCWDDYKPIIIKPQILSSYTVECQNCGMTILFFEEEEVTIEKWNELPR